MFEKLPSSDKYIKTSRIYDVPIDRIVQNKALLREYDTVSVVKLASSIRKIGLIEPIILRLPCHDLPREPEEEFTEIDTSRTLPSPAPEKTKLSQKINDKIADLRKIAEQTKKDETDRRYVLISGGYRLRAYKMLGMSEIPARFALFTENDEASVQIVGEFFGSCSDTFEKARKFVRTCIDMGMNACELAENLGFQQKYAISLFNIAKMSDSEADLASLHKLSFETIAEIAKLDSPIARLALIEEAKDGQFSKKELSQQIEDIKSGKSKSFTQNRRFFCKDMRIYVNTMKKTVKAMVENGINAELDISEGENDLRLTVNVSACTGETLKNVSRETLSVAVEEGRNLSADTLESVEKSVETIENRGVSTENCEFSTDFNKNEAKSSETVENHVENVENLVCTEAPAATITDKTSERDGDRHMPTPKLIKGVV